MGEIKFIAGLLMVVLFMIAILGYTFGFASDNNSEIDISNRSEFSSFKSHSEDNITQFGLVDMNESSEALYTSTIATGDQVTTSGGQFKVGVVSLFTVITSFFLIVKTNIFGGSNAFGIVLLAIGGFLIFVGSRYIYKTWVGKNPD